jgi:hypothetical protein
MDARNCPDLSALLIREPRECRPSQKHERVPEIGVRCVERDGRIGVRLRCDRAGAAAVALCARAPACSHFVRREYGGECERSHLS